MEPGGCPGGRHPPQSTNMRDKGNAGKMQVRVVLSSQRLPGVRVSARGHRSPGRVKLARDGLRLSIVADRDLELDVLTEITRNKW